MKKLVITLILCFPFLGVAQNLSDWQIGININPSIFHRFYDKKPFEYAKQNYPNGLGFGLTVEKNWNERWGIKTGVEYTSQNIKYDNYNSPSNFPDDVNENFNFVKTPLTLQYNIPLKGNLFITFNQGMLLSFLTNYKSVAINPNFQSRTFTPNYFEFISYLDNSISNNVNWEYIYSKLNYGLIGSCGLKGFITEKLSYSTNIRYEYDFTNSNNKYTPFESRNFIDPNAAVQQVRNFNIGLEFGIQYHFEQLIRFNKNPK